jgi:hypothetical protein
MVFVPKREWLHHGLVFRRPMVSSRNGRFCGGMKLSVERLFMMTLLIFYLGFSWWAINLHPQTEQAMDNIPMDLPGSVETPTSRISPLYNSNNSINNHLEKLSSVDFYACCGLGHRLVRMSQAAYIARERNFSVRSFWGWCGEQNPVEVFSYLFRPYYATEVPHVRSGNQVLPFYNEVPGFRAIARNGTKSDATCPCNTDKIDSDLELYQSLRTRFRGSARMNDFVREHFVNATVVGIHVRTGNGEVGDFEQKGRDISDPDLWVHQVCTLLQGLWQLEHLKKPPIVFVATDSPSMVARFRNELTSINVPVYDLPQSERRKEGEGVLFGTSAKVYNTAENKSLIDDSTSCLQGWSDTITDMLLLSHADIVVASRPSSFVQTLPMSLAFGKPKQDRVFQEVYCEIISQSELTVNKTLGSQEEWTESDPTMQCYESYEDWCCNHSTWIKFRHTGPKGHTKVISREFVRFPQHHHIEANIEYKGLRNRTMNCQRPRRGRVGGGWKDKCLPHSWTSE